MTDGERLKEAMRLLSLIAAEFKSDPMSVQCFDIHSIVKPTIALVEKHKESP